VVERSRRIAALDVDLEEPLRRLASCPIVGPLLEARPGLRPPGAWDPLETGVRAIVGQQVSVAAANTIAGRLVERLGTPVAGLRPLGLTHTFPPPETIAGADLDGLGLTRRRAAAIRAFARAVADDTIRLDRSVGLDQLTAAITAIDGLGPWTAQYVALRLGEPDAYPAGDLGLPRRGDPSFAERWRPWRALAATHLWFADGAGHRRRAA
jgi:AraC family transcriptional regulator of adaptative response / DNA-3-methyladenine glycosylase II